MEGKEFFSLLFPEEVWGLAEDGLVSPEEELKICKEVFSDDSTVDAKRDEPTGAKPSVVLNHGESAVASCSSKRDSSSGHASENMEVKSSSTARLDREKGPDPIYSGTRANLPAEEFVKDPLPCHAVESLGISQRETDDNGNIVTTSGNQPLRDVKVVEDRLLTSPNSQESVATSVTFASAETAHVLECVKESMQESVNFDTVDTVSKTSSARDLPFRLSSYAHHLLEDAGWKIERRKRIDRKKPCLYYIRAEGESPFKSLTVAWKALGETLLLTAPDSELDENGREWTNVDMFWRDMTDTLSYINKMAHHQDKSLSLLHRWQLLDPFMAVVWIDKRVRVLRAGSRVKALKSTTFILTQSDKLISEVMVEKQVDSTPEDPRLGSFGSLNSSIPPVLQKPVVLESSCNRQPPDIQLCHDLESRKGCERSEPQSTCSTDLQKRSNESLTRHTEKGFLDEEYLHMGSEGSVSRSKRSKRSASRSTFMLKDSEFLYYGQQETSDLSADFNTMRPEIQSSALVVSPPGGNTDVAGDNDMIRNTGLPSSQDLSPVLQEDPNIVENIFGTEATKSKQKHTSAMKAVDIPTKVLPKKSEKILQVEATGVSDQCMKRMIHDEPSEAALNMDSNTCDPLGLADHLEGTNGLRMELSSQCLEQLENFEEQMDDFRHASSIERVHGSTVVDILKDKKPLNSDTETKLCGKDKRSDLTMPLEDEQNPTLSKEDKKYSTVMKGERKAKRLNFHRSPSTSSKKQKLKLESNKAKNQINDQKVSVDDISSTIFLGDNISDEVLANSGASPSLELIKKSKSEGKRKPGRKKPTRACINDDELLITALFKKNRGKSSASKVQDSQPKTVGKLKTERGSCRLLPRALGKGGGHARDGKRLFLGERTVLCWLIEMGSVSLKDKVQFRDPKNDMAVKTGRVTREGILCSCCSKILSVSEFKTHAGFEQQKPPLSLFLQSDKPYTLCQLQAWSTEYKARNSRMQVKESEETDENDDTCALCGDGGELVCCDNCPSTYHQSCLSAQDLPEGSWYCPNCICRTCGDVADGKEVSNSLAMFKCSQCEHKYHGTCIKSKLPCTVELGSSKWFCGENCQEAYLGFHSRVGVVNPIDDGFSWTILRCSHVDQKVGSKQKIALMAECNAKLAVALTLMEECFVPMVDTRTGIDMIPHVLYNWGSKFPRLNYEGFYAVVLEKGDVLVCVASIRLHGVTLAEMPLVATCSEHRRQGMCRLLLNAIEKLLISLKVKMLVLTAIPSLVETWTTGFGFEPVEDEEKQQLTNVNLMKFPETVLLKKNLCEDSADRSGGNVDLHSRDLVEMANALPGGDLGALSLFPAITEVPVKQIDGEQRDIWNAYGESSLPTTLDCQHGDGSA